MNRRNFMRLGALFVPLPYAPERVYSFASPMAFAEPSAHAASFTLYMGSRILARGPIPADGHILWTNDTGQPVILTRADVHYGPHTGPMSLSSNVLVDAAELRLTSFTITQELT